MRARKSNDLKLTTKKYLFFYQTQRETLQFIEPNKKR